MLNARLSSILRELMAARNSLTSQYLANVIQVTSRTIRNDIKELDRLLSANGAGIKSVRGSGYELRIDDDQRFLKLLKEVFQNSSLHEDLPTLPEERIRYLIKRLLLSDKFVKLDELADELYISRSTVQNDLREVKKILQAYGIVLEKRPNYGVKLRGEEVKLRFCMSEYIFRRRGTEHDMIAHSSILPSAEMDAVRNIILDEVKQNKITLSDIGLINLIIHIAIACLRIRNGNYVSIYPDEFMDIMKQKEYEVAKEVVKKIDSALQVVFPETEIAYVAIHLMGTKIVANPNIGDKEIQNFLDKSIYDLTMKILDKIENKLMLGVKQDKELVVGLSLHLKPAINRYKYGMNLRNPLLNEIKSNYPVAFESGILAGMVLKEEIGIDVHESEIAYLALHIGAAIERRNMNNQLKRCMIVCASGLGSARLLFYKLQSKFSGALEVVGTTEYYKINEIPFDTLDFIVSTIPIREPLPIPVIEVNTILGGKDFHRIEMVINHRSDITIDYTREELVFLQEKFETRDEVLLFLENMLKSYGLVDDTFIQSVFEREALSPTCFGNMVAIPHPMVPQTEETFWVICTLQKPIVWANKRVQFVCLLCVEKNSSSDLQEMYRLLGKVVDDASLVQQLVRCRTYKDFTSVFASQ
ncbi:BglG family transcription antiterminator [Bacillus canaveralius]|uniref:BglG family transcription antiterminator n=1 Tax=Bacillus canaveralius TaxID=1403243 RepID=UPI000F76B0F3|nr:BglG family transcription antiterminator [Bacillus canaveralius]RSK52612.1 transcription antiterminator [Bacillus canaveralius]